MTNTVEPITDKRRNDLKVSIRAASPTVESDLRAYEARLSAVEEENKDLRKVLYPFLLEAERLERKGYTSANVKETNVLSPAATIDTLLAYGDFWEVRNALSKGKDDG